MLTERSQLGAVAGWYISPESLQKGYDPGIDDYMVKSGDFSGLLMRVRHCCAGPILRPAGSCPWTDFFCMPTR